MSFLNKIFTNNVRSLHEAAQVGDFEKVKTLVNANPDLVTAKANNGETVLHIAAKYGDMHMAEFLIAKKADVNAKSDTGVTPLHYGASRKEMAKLLLASKADVNAKAHNGFTALHYGAVWNHHNESVELLLTNKADVNAKDTDGHTPLFYAEQKGHKRVAELLRQNGGHA